MTNDELIQKFNPAAAGSLTEADLAILRGLSTDQIGVLAKAYPNQGHQKPYLLLHDAAVPDNKQLYPLSTWQNLYNLHKFHSKKNFTAYTFRALFGSKKAPALQGVRTATANTGKVVDLSSTEAAALLRENFGGKVGTSGNAPKDTKKPAAIHNPKAPGKGKTVDLAGKTKTGKKTEAPKVSTQPNDDEEMQDFDESE